MTKKETKSLLEQRAVVWLEMLQHLADQYGYSSFAGLDSGKRDELDEELEDAVENWGEADVDNIGGVPVTTPFQRLLAKYHELGESLMDIRDGQTAAILDLVREYPNVTLAEMAEALPDATARDVATAYDMLALEEEDSEDTA